MRLDAPILLAAAPIVALLIGILALWARRERVVHAARWSDDLSASARRLGTHGWVGLSVAALSATAALAGPRWGSRTVTAETKGLNMVIAVDVSRSMLAEDVSPSRLGKAQREARRLIHDHANDRIGLLAFAGRSYILSPLTIDGGALESLVDALDPGIVSAGGTSLARALRQGRELLLGGDDVADRVLVLFTDGESHDSLEAALGPAERLRRDGVRLILVAEGRREPMRIPSRGADGGDSYHRDASGNIVETRRRDDVLMAVADAAQGVLVSGELSDQAGAVRDLVTAYKRAPHATATTSTGVSRAWLLSLTAVLVLLAHTLTRRTAALAVMLLGFAAVPRLNAQGPRNQADAAWADGDFDRAAALYLEQVRAGEGGDTTLLNTGTAGFARGDTALAAEALGRAAESLEPGIRFRALYNLGLLRLRMADADTAHRSTHLARARRYYREALLLEPGDAAAKWNLELAVERAPPSGGGGQAPQQQAPTTGGSGEPQSPTAGLSLAQAEQILNSIAEEERRTRHAVQQRRNQSSGNPQEPDW